MCIRDRYSLVTNTTGYHDPVSNITTGATIDSNDHWYVRFIRNGTDSSFTVEFYDNSARTGTPLTSTRTSVTTVTPYKYFGVYDDTDFGGSNKHIGEISQIKLYDGVSSLSSKPTNVQVGSRFEETNTRKMYSYNEPDFNKTDCVGYYTLDEACLLYTSPSPRDLSTSRMPSSA